MIKKVEKKKTWKPVSPSVAEVVVRGLSHLSGKTINTNSVAAAVRMAASDHAHLPYVAVSTMPPGHVPMDFAGSARQVGIAQQLMAWSTGEVGQLYENEPEGDERDVCDKAVVAMKGGGVLGGDYVSKRLRQIIVQDSYGNDVVLTPLQASGFSSVLTERLQDELEQSDGKKRLRGYLSIGGSNPQNAGLHARAMARPLYFDAPAEDERLRAAWHYHYKGIRLDPSRKPLEALFAWRKAYLMSEKKVSRMYDREAEARLVRDLAIALRHRADDALEALQEFAETLPGDALVSTSVPKHVRALIDPRMRYHRWEIDVATVVRRRIARSKIRDDGMLKSMGVSDADSAPWETIIAEVIA